MSRPNKQLDDAINDLTAAVGQLLRRLRSQDENSELNLSQWSVIGRLHREGTATTAELARAEAMKPQSMGAVLAALEDAGLVSRQAHPSDGRQILFDLTAAGIALRSKRREIKHAWLMQAIGKLSPAEQATLIAAIPLIKRLSDN